MAGLIIVGSLAVVFGGFAVAQLVTQRRITLYGITDKELDPKQFWATTAAYTAGCLACLYFMREFIQGVL